MEPASGVDCAQDRVWGLEVTAVRNDTANKHDREKKRKERIGT